MNYYRRHIGDYLRDTAHLSLLEHGIYARLLDVYYTREEALPPLEQTARLIGARSKDERAALELVLREFFEEVDGRWRQARCEREIEESQRKAERNREVGKLGGNPKKKRGYNEPGVLYAVRVGGDGPVKVGISKWIASRLSALRSKHPGLQVLATVDVADMGTAEAAVHDTFSDRLDGEWINAPWTEIESAIHAVAAPSSQPSGHPTASQLAPLANSHKPIANSQQPVGTERASRATHARTRAPAKRPIPDGFGISDRVAEWAQRNGHGRLQEHLEAFVSKAKARGYVYVDWDEALMGAIRDDWAGLNAPAARASPHRQPTLSERNAAAIREFMAGECHDPFAPSAPAPEVIDV